MILMQALSCLPLAFRLCSVDESTASILRREVLHNGSVDKRPADCCVLGFWLQVSDGCIAPGYQEKALKMLREKKGGRSDAHTHTLTRNM
jgi:hypothetical protein